MPRSVYTTVYVARLVGQCSNWLCAVPFSGSVTAVRTLTLVEFRLSKFKHRVHVHSVSYTHLVE